MRRPLVVAATCFPAIATRTCLGVNASRTVMSEPRAATDAFFVGANGAPQRPLQHHDEIASGTVEDAVESVAFGGPTSASAAISATTDERYRESRKKEFARRRKNHPSSAKPDVESAGVRG
jgi:hypothetical protein